MAKYIINEQKSDLTSVAQEVEQIGRQRSAAAPGGGQTEEMHAAAEALHALAPRADATVTPDRQRRTLLLGLGAGILLAVALLGLFFAIRAVASNRRQPLPDLVGMREADAKASLDKLGFQVTIEYDSQAKQPSGTVTVMLPPARTKLRRGEKPVTLRIAGKGAASGSSGGMQLGTPTPPPLPTGQPATPHPAPGKTSPGSPVIVPKLAGMSLDTARQKLAELGIKYEEVQVNDAGGEAGLVLETEPAAGAELPPGTLLRLKVSGRAATSSAPGAVVAVSTSLVTMPDLRSVPAGQARDTLRGLGLKDRLSYVQTYSGNVKNLVIAQDPVGGTPVPLGTTVSLFVGQ